jgi:hypothetical protein
MLLDYRFRPRYNSFCPVIEFYILQIAYMSIFHKITVVIQSFACRIHEWIEAKVKVSRSDI